MSEQTPIRPEQPAKSPDKPEDDVVHPPSESRETPIKPE